MSLWNELMLAKGTTRPSVQASESGVPRSTIYRLLEGKTEATLPTAMKLAKYAGISVELLFPAARESRTA